MIHARKDYNRIQDPENLIGEKEPVFLIRAKDIVAARAVRMWAELHLAAGGNEDIAKLARSHAARIEKWQEKNERKTKTADL